MAENKIGDFGKKIGGARKDLWLSRGLSSEDLDEMNLSEKMKYATKNYIWRKVDYEKMLQAGIPREVIYYKKLMKDSFPSKPPKIERWHTEEEILARIERYVEFANEYKEQLEKVTTAEDIKNFNSFVRRNTVPLGYGGYVKPLDGYEGLITNKMLKNAKMDISRLEREVAGKQFLYSEDEKILSVYRFFKYSKDETELEDYIHRNGDSRLKIGKGFPNFYIYLSNDEKINLDDWKDGTWFVTSLNNYSVLAFNQDTKESAQQAILTNIKQSLKAQEAKENNEKREDDKRKRKKKFSAPILNHIKRDEDGTHDYRKGKQVTGQDYLDTFGFYGGEFGNWLTEADRQGSLDFGFDAFLDIANALGIEAKDLSLGGNLSIAFGARGHSSAVAHYEMERKVINITKMRGAGSLAHEFGHALDDIVGRQLGNKDTSGFMSKNLPTDPDVRTAVKGLMGAINSRPKTIEDCQREKDDYIAFKKARMQRIINIIFPPRRVQEMTEEQRERLSQYIDEYYNSAEKYGDQLTRELKGTNYKYYLNATDDNPVEKMRYLYGEAFAPDGFSQEWKRVLMTEQYELKKEIEKPVVLEDGALTTSDYYRNSKIFDGNFSKEDKGYWSSDVEMFARAFACYVKDKLDYRSDYLVGHADSYFGEDMNGNIITAMPVGEERQRINRQFDNLINVLKEKEILHQRDENIPLYENCYKAPVKKAPVQHIVNSASSHVSSGKTIEEMIAENEAKGIKPGKKKQKKKDEHKFEQITLF